MAQRTKGGRGAWSPRGRPIAARPQPRPLIGPFAAPPPPRPSPGRLGTALPPPGAAGPGRASREAAGPAECRRGPARRPGWASGQGAGVLGWGKTPGAGVSRAPGGEKGKVGGLDCRPISLPLPVLGELVSVSLLPPLLFIHHDCHLSQKHTSLTNIRSGKDSWTSWNIHLRGSLAP